MFPLSRTLIPSCAACAAYTVTSSFGPLFFLIFFFSRLTNQRQIDNVFSLKKKKKKKDNASDDVGVYVTQMGPLACERQVI
jgi:hypothetical protein